MSKDIFTERRSINFFDSSKKIEEETLKEILDLAVLAPSAFNLQPWKIIAASSDEAKDRLLPLAFQQPKVKEAAYTLIIVGDRQGYDQENPTWKNIEQAAGKEAAENAMAMAANLYGSSEERKIKFAESNAGLLAMSIMYAAKAKGIDSHPMSGIDFQGIKNEFSLKESEEVVMLIALGYHDDSKEISPRAERKTKKELVEFI